MCLSEFSRRDTLDCRHLIIAAPRSYSGERDTLRGFRRVGDDIGIHMERAHTNSKIPTGVGRFEELNEIAFPFVIDLIGTTYANRGAEGEIQSLPCAE